MPRYFFHLVDGKPERDRRGTPLRDAAEAEVEAIRLVRDLLEERADEQFWNGQPWSIVVKDDTGKRLFAVTVAVTREALSH